MRANSKVVYAKVREHILECVYNSKEEQFSSFELACEYLALEFIRVADYPNNIKRIPGNQKRFEDYMRGIAFHFEFEDHKIEEFLNGLGINSDNKKYSSDAMWGMYTSLIWREVQKYYFINC